MDLRQGQGQLKLLLDPTRSSNSSYEVSVVTPFVIQLFSTIAQGGEEYVNEVCNEIIVILRDHKIEKFVNQAAVKAIGDIAKSRKGLPKVIECLNTMLSTTNIRRHGNQDVIEILAGIVKDGQLVAKEALKVLIQVTKTTKNYSVIDALREIAKSENVYAEEILEVFIELLKGPYNSSFFISILSATEELVKNGQVLSPRVLELIAGLGRDDESDVKSFVLQVFKAVVKNGIT